MYNIIGNEESNIESIQYIGEEEVYEIHNKNELEKCGLAPVYKREPRYVMSRDYSSQEYLTLAILSKDSKMIDNFKRGLDPHTSTAYAIWGEENYTKEKRKKAKTCLGGNSFVLTGNGLCRPYKLTGGAQKIADKNGNLQSFAMTKEYGDLIRIQYDTGICEEYTPNHKVEVWNGSSFEWKEVKDLTKDDNVVQLCGVQNVLPNTYNINVAAHVGASYSKKETNIDISTDEFAYISGLFVACGTSADSKSPKGRKGGVAITFKSVPNLPRILDCLNKIGVNTDKYCSIRKNGSLVITFAPLMYLLNSMYGKRKKLKTIPDIVYKVWTTTRICFFLLGILENSYHNSVNGATCFSFPNKELVRSVALLASLAGLRTKLNIVKSYNQYRLFIKGRGKSNILAELGKILSYKTNLQRNNWKINHEFIREFKKANYSMLAEKKCLNVFNQIMSKNFKSLPYKLIDKISSLRVGFPIRRNMVCAKVLFKEATEGDIYVIETENHEYVSSCIVSHNCNFLINYGGNEYGLADSLEIPIEEAREIIKGYEEAFFECIQWKKNEIQKMMKNGGVVFTEFGRPRQFGSWIRMSANMDPKEGEGLQNRVNRRVASHQIQGLCGDICRNVLLKLYEKYFKHRDPDIDFLSTVHDEVNFTVTKSKLIDYARECEDIMKFDVLRKDLPISTSLDVGYSYGNCFPFIWEDDTRTKLIPKRI